MLISTDPDTYTAPLGGCSPRITRPRLAARIDPTRASRATTSRVPRGGGTIWLGVVDRWGSAVSLVQSNYMTFGSGVTDPSTGVVFQNRGSYFSLDPGHRNVLGPSKRTLHTLMPGMLFRADNRGS